MKLIKDAMGRCKNPHACATAAIDRVRQIKPKWTEAKAPTQVADPGNDVVFFIPPNSITSLTQGLRALKKRVNEAKERPAPRTQRRTRADTPSAGTTVTPRNAAAGIFYGVDDVRNKGFRIPVDEIQSPYAAEVYTVLDAVRNADTNSVLTIASSQSELKARKGSTLFEIAEPGSVTKEYRQRAMTLAKQSVRSTNVTTFGLSVPDGMALPGMILGCGLAEFRDGDGKRHEGTERLYQILEAAYLIWKIRNERVINRDGAPATDQEIINKWHYHINHRLQVDKILANCPPEEKKSALAPKKVLETWSGILAEEGTMPENWLREPRVLVGGRAMQTRPDSGIG
ncbi:hypothetical protein B0H13DRAFT_1877425 [Mycena leptocephala]|nr:hypothetical protein B0H13DRAFT_1877425 [Mycena leptocephala]